mgnify:CR=1 FL=1
MTKRRIVVMLELEFFTGLLLIALTTMLYLGITNIATVIRDTKTTQQEPPNAKP